MAEKTLQSMAAGGVYDHVGGGFHRYSVDEHWHVPHFEKVTGPAAASREACWGPKLSSISAGQLRRGRLGLIYFLRHAYCDANGSCSCTTD